jgi:probable rRNA maturation factor
LALRIDIANRQDRVAVPKALLRRAARTVLGDEACPGEISIAVLDDTETERLNRRFLGHEGPTDVISFCYSEPGEALSGEVIVNAECAERDADRRGHEARDELLLYLVHGLLHLVGYDDHTPAQRRVMHARALEILSRLGIKLAETDP